MNKNYYITTPIYYVNDKPHIGHAYTTLACDVAARFKRQDGYDVFFLTGTDEHGQKIERAATQKNINPKDFVDGVSKSFLELAEKLNISNNRFIRTTDDDHKKACQKLWSKLYDNGYIYKDKYSGWYSVRDEAYFTESDLVEKDGKKIAPTGADVEWMEEESYFFKLSAFTKKLLKHYEDNPNFIQPNTRKNEIISFVGGKEGLRDISISRTSFDWGVKVPGDEKHVMYVWLDALTNYITAVGYGVGDVNDYWKNAHHIVGKDIIKFHAVYWPAFLMAADLELPKNIFAHGWWTNEGQKISKSLGNTIDPNDLIAEFGVDQLRYFLMREITFGNDGDYSRLSFITRVNSDLSNDIGNLCQRVCSFIYKKCDGNIKFSGNFTKEDKELLSKTSSVINELRINIDNKEFNKYCENVWKIISCCNKYIDEQQPWVKFKEDYERMSDILYVMINMLKDISILAHPIIPSSALSILDIINYEGELKFDGVGELLSSDISVKEPYIIFPRFDLD